MVRTLSAGLLVAVVAAACTDSSNVGGDPAPAARPTVVLTSNYPLAYFARRVAGDLVDVDLPAPGDQDPAFWKPDRDALLRFQAADLLLFNGAGYEPWAETVSLPLGREVDSTRPFADRLIETGESAVHSHGPGGAHSHPSIAFTTWLDPMLAIAQAREVERGLLRILPDREEELTAGFRGLEADLRGLDAELRAAVAADPGRLLIASHPVYQYLQRRYALALRSVHWEPEELPSDAQWVEFDALRADHPARWMIWEGAPRPEVVVALEQRGVRCVVFDPCANVPDDGDYLAVMRRNAAELARAFTADDR